MGNLTGASTKEQRDEARKLEDMVRRCHPRAVGDMTTVTEQIPRRTGLELLRDTNTTVEEIATLIGYGHPPVGHVDCDRITCKD